MRIVRGRKQEEMDAAAFDALASGFAGVVVDVGTGDGLLPYRMAVDDPGTLYVGCDPVAENMADVAVRSRRKPAKGGVGNLLLVVTTVEDPPPELRGRADALHCVLPWGRLMEGIATGDQAVLSGLRSFARPGAPLRVVLNVGVWDVSTPLHVEPLPEVTDEHVRRVLGPAFAQAGFDIGGHGDVGPADVRALRSTWARRLTHGGAGRFLEIEAVAR
jgi:16S rRNA (adenine(1408)-N(1))-methyltransferase